VNKIAENQAIEERKKLDEKNPSKNKKNSFQEPHTYDVSVEANNDYFKVNNEMKPN